MKNTRTVTAGDWAVSTTTSSHQSGVELHTFKLRGAKIQKGEGYGRRFETTDQAVAWALEHGYLEPFVTAWCRHCRTAHTLLGRRSGHCPDLHVFTGAAGRYNVRTGQVDLPNLPIGGVRS